MCDDFTLQDDAEWQTLLRTSRRGFALGVAGTAALGGCMGRGQTSATPSPTGANVAESMVKIATSDGQADAFFARPSKGRHPAVLVWPDIMGLRDSFRDMGRRLAQAGFATLVVNHYYRSAADPVLPPGSSFSDPASRAKVQPWGKLLDPAAYARDAAAFIAWLDRQKAVDAGRKVGTVGHCMTGPAALRTAAAVPERVGAAASMHGARLVTDTADSPHLTLAQSRADILVAIAQNDDAREPEAKTKLREACDSARRTCEIEVYPAQHGWTVTDSPVYDRVQAERAWKRLLATFAKL
jgi:carboxymethylenebutenolidase